MKFYQTIFSLILITLIYLTALFWADSKNSVFTLLPNLINILPLLITVSLLSYFVRYVRWLWLLKRANHPINNVFLGFCAYLAGFAFTATPGKAGELIRIRYFKTFGVSSWRVLSAFIYERACDLFAVLLLASLAISRKELFLFVTGFIVIFIGILMFFALNIKWFTKIAAYLYLYRFKKLARICLILKNGLSGCRVWMTPIDFSYSLGLGVVAWGVTSLSFVYLLTHLHISLPFLSAFAIYPLAMLAGAASMLPGGVGSTEVTIVSILMMNDVQIGTATLAAVGIRFATIWFAIICGVLNTCVLEFLSNTKNHFYDLE